MSDEPLRYLDANSRPSFVSSTSRLPVDIGTSGTVNISGDVIAEFDGVEEALGAPADAAASSDTATTGLIGLMKRLLGKLPALVNGKIPVDAAVTISGGATEAKQDTGNASLSSIDGKLPALSSGAVPVATDVQKGTGVITSTTTRVTLATDGPGLANLASIAGFQIPAYDNLVITYRTSGNGTGKIDQVVFKVSSTAVGTLTLAYDSSNRLSTVTKS